MSCMFNLLTVRAPRICMRKFVRILAALVVCTLVLTAGIAPIAQATVVVEGNVLLSEDGGATFYADNPATSFNEGIPNAGNSINTGQGTNQLNFEGRPDNKNTADPSDDENVNFDIYVGRTSFGSLTINGDTELRDMNLIIGDAGVLPGSPQIRRGNGFVYIQGPGAVYNSDPLILPFPYDQTGDSPSINDRTAEPGAATGFDVYVGRAGNGTLAISAQGRAEIQDAVIAADQSGTFGTITIDGVGTFMQSGGFQTNTSNDPNQINYMVIGRLGTGSMSITNGGQSYNSGPIATSGNSEQWAAVIGSNLAASTTTPPASGGSGTVLVDGPGSTWTLAGNLQVGGFHNNRVGSGPFSEEDLEGELAIYGPGVGRGTLKVSNGGLVSIVPPPLNATASNAPDRLDFLVGRFGRVELDGGNIQLTGAFDNTNPENPTQELTRGRLINDGVVTGHGTISVLQFRNRVLGEVRVDPGQSLVIAATGTYAQADNFPLPSEPEEYPLSNYGLIKVQGTPETLAQIEFQRSLGSEIPPSPLQGRPFLNLPSPPAPNGRTGGEIVASNSVLKFDSGIINRHKVTFTGGTNLVTGDFVNAGTVVVGGIDTTVNFVDQFFNFGTLTLEPSVSLVNFIDDVDFDPDPVALNLSETGPRILNMTFGNHIASDEIIRLGGTLNVSVFNAPGFPGTVPLAGAQYEIISSAAGLIGDFATVNLPCELSICFVGAPDYTLNAYFIRSFDPASPSIVGGDFDGSGLVDELDLQIWRRQLGESGPPGSLPGDANDDGIVDGVDFLIWQMQFGTPGMPVPGAGSGAGGLPGGNFAVPEPASAVLALLGGMLALAFARRRDR